MTINTANNSAMLAGVTVDTIHPTVSSMACRQQIDLISVTGAALLGRQGSVEGNPSRCMRITVTTETVGVILSRVVRLVTFGAVHRFAVLRMATGAILIRMQARCHGKGFSHTSMTAAASRLRVYRLRQITIQGIVRQVALLTIDNCIMRIILRVMTAGTFRDNILTERRMSTVTTDTGLFPVLTAMLLQQGCRFAMTRGADRAGLGRSRLDHLRQVRRVALQTVAERHIWDMRLMALLTLLRRTMLTDVAFTAIERGMFVRMLFVEPFLIIMAGQANLFDFAELTQIHFQWLVRIMAAGAVFQGKMTPCRFGVTAVTAFAEHLAVRFMFWVTRSTTVQILLMSSTLGLQRTGLVLMTGSAELLRDGSIQLQTDILRLMR